MNWMRHQHSRFGIGLIMAAMILGSSPVRGSDNQLGGEKIDAGHVSLGGRGTWYDPKDGDAKWYGGGQLRFYGSTFGLEGSADYRQDEQGGTKVETFPVQASLLAFIMPGSPVRPFLLAGTGWYFTH